MLSIIINNYNYACYLREAIDSALCQTHADIEVIVVDDGSTDHSREIIESYGNRILPVFKSNGGQASAFNAGFAQASGDIIYFLDADDVMMPQLIESVIPCFLDESVALVQFPLMIEEVLKPEQTGKLFPSLPLQGDPLSEMLRFGIYVAPPTSGNIFSRKMLEQILPMPEESFRLCADLYLVVLGPFHGSRTVIQSPLAKYRIHGLNHFMSGPQQKLSKERRLIRLQYSLARVELIEIEAQRRALRVSSVIYSGDINLLYTWLYVRRVYPSAGILRDRSIFFFIKQLSFVLFRDQVQPTGVRFWLWLKCWILLFFRIG